MAIPWLTVLSSVPWTEVIKNAPRVADGAKKLWQAIGRKEPASEAVTGTDAAATQEPNDPVDVLHGRIAGLEARVSELHAQMLASSELIKQLADQNAQLIERIELNRVRTARLAGAVAAIVLLAGAALALALTG